MSTFSNLQAFLFAHPCPKGQKATHTRIPDKDLNIYAGAYLIPPADLPEFYRLYANHIFKQGKNEYLTERQLEKNGQMMVDLDFRYNYNVEQRIHTKEHVNNIVIQYLETMKDVMVFDKETAFSVFVMEKPDVNRLADGSLTKDGIHISFGLCVDYDKQLYIRKKMIEFAPQVCNDLPLINDWESVFDEGISKGTTNWQLFGSRKPGNQAYEIKYKYEIKYDTADGEFMIDETEINFNPIEHLKYLSAQFQEYHEYPTNPKWSNNKTAPAKKKMMRVPSVANVTDSDTEVNEQNVTEVSEQHKMVKDLLFNWIGSRFNKCGLTKRIEYGDKLKVSSALKTLELPFKLFQEWCLFGAEREIKDPMIMWKSCHLMDNKHIALLCIENILKGIDKRQFRSWRLDHHSEAVIDNMLTGEENTKAKYIAQDISRELVYCGEQWFMLNSTTKLWSVVKKPHALVSNYLTAILNDEHEVYLRKYNDTTNDEKREHYKKIIAKIGDAIWHSGMSARISSVLTFLSSYICDNEFRKKLDINLYRIPYKNGMLCLKTLEFRQGILSSDYITKTIKFDYELPTQEHLEIVKKELKKIFNWNDKHLDYGMSFYGYAMTSDARKEQHMWCMKGENASNGKSVVPTALTDLMPEFVTCFPSEMFESSYGDRHKMIAEWNGLKIGWLNELRKGKKQDEAFMKLVAEATPQDYKVMYGTKDKMPITFKALFVGNHQMKIDADEGVRRRYRHLQMDSDFQDHNDDNYETRKFKKDKKFGELLTTTYRDALLHFIYTYSKAYYEEQKLKPYPIDWEIEGKKQMDDNNEVLVWFNKHFELDADGKVENRIFMSYVDEKIVTDQELKSLRKKFNYDSQKMGPYHETIDKEGKVVKKQTKGMWSGFKLRTDEEDEE